MPKKNIPSYRLHKPSGQAIVSLSGKMIYLGKYKTPESREKYTQIIAEYTANDCRLPPAKIQSKVRMEQLVTDYLNDLAKSYPPKKGTRHTPFTRSAAILGTVVSLYGKSCVSEFSPTSVLFIRDKWVDSGIARKTVNYRVGVIKQMFRWGQTYGLVPTDVYYAINAVPNLKAGRTKAPEYKDILPVDMAIVEKTLPYLKPIIADMVRVQLLAGMRPQDVRNMRSVDIDQSNKVWKYKPFTHKNKHRGKIRELAIGPKAQAVLLPYLNKEQASEFLFLTQTKRQYDDSGYSQAITHACKKAGVEPWSPNQLRHSAGTRIRDEYGLEHAQAVLGHSSAKTTEIYAKVNFEKAAAVMEEIG